MTYKAIFHTTGAGIPPQSHLIPRMMTISLPLIGLMVAISSWFLAGLTVVIAIPLCFALGIWLLPIRFVRGVLLGACLSSSIASKSMGWRDFPKTRSVLLTPNHISWLDGFLVMLLAPRHVCMLVYAGNIQTRLDPLAGSRLEGDPDQPGTEINCQGP